MAMPLDKDRTLPGWMKGSAKRVSLSPENHQKNPHQKQQRVKPKAGTISSLVLINYQPNAS